MSRDLIFSSPVSGPDLVFGQDDNLVPQNATGDLSAAMPALAASISVDTVVFGTLHATMPGMSMAVSAEYKTHAQRPVVGKVAVVWQQGTADEVGSTAGHGDGDSLPTTAHSAWSDAVASCNITRVAQRGNLRHERTGRASGFSPARQNPTKLVRALHEDADRRARTSGAAGFESAKGLRSRKTTSAFQDAIRGIGSGSRYESMRAKAHAPFGPVDSVEGANKLPINFVSGFQDAIPAPAGKYSPVVPPITPETAHNADLVFSTLLGGTDLVFYPPGYVPPVTPTGTTVIPVKRAYIVVNEVYLRLRAGLELPCYSVSMSLDRNSWTWGFSASLHASALTLVEPSTYGEPVEVEVIVSGKSYYFLAENISRDRTFTSTRINVTGRGRAALLADPYSAVKTFTNTELRSAQQLMADVLTENGVSLGWDIDFGLTDWNIPAGVFSHTGTFVSAINAIASAAGGYVHADPVLDQLSVKPLYPAVPWEWSSQVPDIELPASVVSKEGVSLGNRPAYNGVYVSGSGEGVMALVKKAGTAGELLAPMVVDPLITEEPAARQRGVSILGDTGRVATVSLSLPVLPETGIIVPGKFIRYVDNGTPRIGLSRGVQFSHTHPTARQIIEVETHV